MESRSFVPYNYHHGSFFNKDETGEVDTEINPEKVKAVVIGAQPHGASVDNRFDFGKRVRVPYTREVFKCLEANGFLEEDSQYVFTNICPVVNPSIENYYEDIVQNEQVINDHQQFLLNLSDMVDCPFFWATGYCEANDSSERMNGRKLEFYQIKFIQDFRNTTYQKLLTGSTRKHYAMFGIGKKGFPIHPGSLRVGIEDTESKYDKLQRFQWIPGMNKCGAIVNNEKFSEGLWSDI